MQFRSQQFRRGKILKAHKRTDLHTEEKLNITHYTWSEYFSIGSVIPPPIQLSLFINFKRCNFAIYPKRPFMNKVKWTIKYGKLTRKIYIFLKWLTLNTQISKIHHVFPLLWAFSFLLIVHVAKMNSPQPTWKITYIRRQLC